MGKIRHIVIRCEDPDKTAQWLQDALELGGHQPHPAAGTVHVGE